MKSAMIIALMVIVPTILAARMLQKTGLTESLAKADSKAEPEAKSAADSDVKSKADSKAEPMAKSTTDSEVKSKAESKTESKAKSLHKGNKSLRDDDQTLSFSQKPATTDGGKKVAFQAAMGENWFLFGSGDEGGSFKWNMMWDQPTKSYMLGDGKKNKKAVMAELKEYANQNGIKLVRSPRQTDGYGDSDSPPKLRIALLQDVDGVECWITNSGGVGKYLAPPTPDASEEELGAYAQAVDDGYAVNEDEEAAYGTDEDADDDHDDSYD